jgi:hypothetical protein
MTWFVCIIAAFDLELDEGEMAQAIFLQQLFSTELSNFLIFQRHMFRSSEELKKYLNIFHDSESSNVHLWFERKIHSVS